MSLNASSYKAILSGWSWAGYDVYNAPMVVTYSFPESQPSWHEGAYGDDAFAAMSAGQRTVIELALSKWEAACGITFVEAEGDHGDITFSNYDFTTMGNGSSAQAFAYYPYNTEWEVKGAVGDLLDISGDVFFRDDLAASQLLAVAMHEIGHAIGLKHTFDTENNHEEVLDHSDDFWANSVMSYDGEHTDTLGKLDLIAAAKLYGDASSEGAGAAKMKWSAATETLKQVGDAGNETIRGVNLKDIVSAGDGGDKIFTFAGDDVINGGRGKDNIWSGAGEDMVYFARGSGSDVIHDFDDVSDVLHFKVKGVHELDDLVFRQKGDDLVIKWRDGDTVGAVRLVDMQEIWLGDHALAFG